MRFPLLILVLFTLTVITLALTPSAPQFAGSTKPVEEVPCKDKPEKVDKKISECGLTQPEKQQLKGKEIATKGFIGTYELDGLTIEVQQLEEIDGGVQLFARAWRGKQQLGFGSTGTVEWERFIFTNPPVLVDDPAGDIVREWTDETGTHQRTLREDPALAMKQTLAHTIKVSSRTDKAIVLGSRGNTTTTVFPAAGAVSPVDGEIGNTGTVYATVQSASAGSNTTNNQTSRSFAQNYFESPTYTVRRGFFGFDIAAIGTEVISAATFSVASNGGAAENANSDTIDVVSATPATSDTLILGDFDQVGTTVYGSMALSSWNGTDTVYNDFTLTPTGYAYVDAWATVGFLATRLHRDTTATAPTGGNNVTAYMADQTGTSADPKLVITSAAAGGGATFDFGAWFGF